MELPCISARKETQTDQPAVHRAEGIADWASGGSAEQPRMAREDFRGLYRLGTDSPRELPLRGVRCSAQLLHTVAGIELEQTYRNNLAERLELLYVFPVSAGAAVSGFEARVGERAIKGEVKKKSEASAEYDDALAAGFRGYYLDQASSSDLLSMRLGNVESGAEIMIKIFYSFVCDVGGDRVTLKLPTTIKERYTPGGEKPKQLSDEPAFASGLSSCLKMDLQVYMSGTIMEVSSPTHALCVDSDPTNDNHAFVTLGDSMVGMDQDVIIHIRRPAPRLPSVCLVRTPSLENSHAVMLTFLPEFDASEVLFSEFVFVVDCSGSMAETDRTGCSAIDHCRMALQIFLRSLPEACAFNIVKFGSRFEKLFPHSEPYNAKSLEAATGYIEALDADLGGTEILQPLDNVLKSPPYVWGTPRHIFVLTDGAVTNTDNVIRLVRSNVHTTRVCTFGVGEGVGEHLVRGVARAGRGEACFIRSGEEIAAKVVEQLDKALHPCLELPSIDWGGLEIAHQSPPPNRLPPVYNNTPYIVYGLLKPTSPYQTKVHLNGRLGGQSISFSAEVSPLACQFPEEACHALECVAVQRCVQDLEDGETDEESMKKITDLSLRFQVVSRHTAFIAVEERQEPVSGTMSTIKIPLSSLRRGFQFSETWSSFGDEDGALDLYGVPECGLMEAAYDYDDDFFEGDNCSMDIVNEDAELAACSEISDRNQTTVILQSSGGEPSGDVQQLKRPSPSHTNTAMERIIKLQQADGSWHPSHTLAEVLGGSLGELLKSKPSVIVDLVTADLVWVTCLALAFLDVCGEEQHSVFMLMERKAKRWMSRQPGILHNHIDELAVAAQSAIRTLLTADQSCKVSE